MAAHKFASLKYCLSEKVFTYMIYLLDNFPTWVPANYEDGYRFLAISNLIRVHWLMVR